VAEPSGSGGAEFRLVRPRADALALGWVLDPLAAVMLVMVTLVGLLIFVYSVGYMADDPTSRGFFCFLSLFAAAMLGLVMANSLLLLFICWELVGLASYLLIGFWFQKPSGGGGGEEGLHHHPHRRHRFSAGHGLVVWGDGHAAVLRRRRGCLEGRDGATGAGRPPLGGWPSARHRLADLLRGMGKSGQVPLARVVARRDGRPDAGQRADPRGDHGGGRGVPRGAGLPADGAVAPGAGSVSTARIVVTWVGAVTALFAALIAVAQTDIKRILAYSTVSQLGYMFLGLGTGGVAVGMFHLITHAFFKALLFLGRAR
jgi:NADH-quinone oxidoreductase subunit L